MSEARRRTVTPPSTAARVANSGVDGNARSARTWGAGAVAGQTVATCWMRAPTVGGTLPLGHGEGRPTHLTGRTRPCQTRPLVNTSRPPQRTRSRTSTGAAGRPRSTQAARQRPHERGNRAPVAVPASRELPRTGAGGASGGARAGTHEHEHTGAQGWTEQQRGQAVGHRRRRGAAGSGLPRLEPGKEQGKAGPPAADCKALGLRCSRFTHRV